MSMTYDGIHEFEQAYRLTQHGRTTASMAADALLALERITLRAPTAINKIVGHPSILDVSVFIKKVEEGSLLNDYYVRIFFGSPKKEEEFYEWLRERTGLDKSKVRTLFAIVGTGILAAGATYAVNKYVTGAHANDKAATVLAWNNTIVQIGASELKMSPAEFSAIIDRATARKAANAKDVAKLLRPAKEGDAGAMMEIIGQNELNVPAEVVAAMPTPDQIDEKPAEQDVLHPQVEVFLRASDLDSNSRGWAALIPDITDRRLKLELGPGINPEALYGRKKVIADVVVVMRAQKGGESVPLSYRVVKVNPE